MTGRCPVCGAVTRGTDCTSCEATRRHAVARILAMDALLGDAHDGILSALSGLPCSAPARESIHAALRSLREARRELAGTQEVVR